MPLVTVKSKFQVTLPSKLRETVAIHEGDLLEATVVGGGILLRPKAVVDRAAVAAELAAVLDAAAPARADRGKSEDEILRSSVADVARTRAARKRPRKTARAPLLSPRRS
jgi:AbrB family looped-hinge helix DNA binding protein